MRVEHYDTPFGRLDLVRHDLLEPVDQSYEEAKELIREVVRREAT